MLVVGMAVVEVVVVVVVVVVGKPVMFVKVIELSNVFIIVSMER